MSHYEDVPEVSHVGTFPIHDQAMPDKGSLCLYILFSDEAEILYIGKSRSIRSRVEDHGKHKKFYGYAAWAVLTCDSELQMDVYEKALIWQEQPPINSRNRHTRGNW